MTIEWMAFLEVFAAAMIGAIAVVFFYALALRLLVRAGAVPVVAPAEFTDAITSITPREAKRAAAAAAKAARKNPLTPLQRRIALWGAYASFGLCGLAVLAGIFLIVTF